MEEITEFLRSDISIIILYTMLVALFIITMINYIKFNQYKKKCNNFFKNIGNGTNIQETLEKHMKEVTEVQKVNKEVIHYCEKVDQKYNETLQKVGIIRYNAFQNVGSNLSFALALLDNQNNGIVLNGIYSRDTSNIYAKPIVNGNSEYTLTQEEKEAVHKAIEG